MGSMRRCATIGLALLLGCSTGGADDDGETESGSSGGAQTSGVAESSAGPTSDGATSMSGDTMPGGEDSTGAESGGETSATTGTPGDWEPPFEDVRNYIFGHSLILHSPTANVPRWLDAIADASGYGYSMSGQYGFADTHATNLPPMAQWGIEGVDAAWNDDDGLAFEDIDFNTVLFTEANFRQYYPPTSPEPDVGLTSSVDSTLTVFDWVNAAEPGVRFIVYENWPDMASFTSADFDTVYPSADELAAYHAFTQGEFHQWWLDYHDALRALRPDLTIHMVPVGPILASLLTGPLADIPPEVFYEDDAPHGRESLYFLAGLATSMAIHGRPDPSFEVPEDVDARIRDRYPELVDAIWFELQSFEDPSGTHRIFD